MRFRLRTLMIALAVGPMMLAAGWSSWVCYRNYLLESQEIRITDDLLKLAPPDDLPPHLQSPSAVSPGRKMIDN